MKIECPQKIWRGGARTGFWNATWPFARLILTEDQLVLKVVLLGTYSFSPDLVTSVELYREIGSEGVFIHHRVASYPEKIVFWSPKAQPIIEAMRHAGYGIAKV